MRGVQDRHDPLRAASLTTVFCWLFHGLVVLGAAIIAITTRCRLELRRLSPPPSVPVIIKSLTVLGDIVEQDHDQQGGQVMR
ncbi:MAG TPA: hypothetical protein VF086_07865 [Propionibacteriaceae bacterium]